MSCKNVTRRHRFTKLRQGVNRLANLCAIAASVSVGFSAYAKEAGSNDLDEVTLADELRTAFYEQAPPSLTAMMFKSVGAWCVTADRRRIEDSGGANAETVSWLCGRNKLRYYRSVYITGSKGTHGLICENSGFSYIRYVGIDLAKDGVDDGQCVTAESDGAAYHVYFEGTHPDDATSQ
jgi:hypothetical protein